MIRQRCDALCANGFSSLVNESFVSSCVALRCVAFTAAAVMHTLTLSLFVCFVRLHFQFDVTTEKGMAAFSGFMGSKSYIEGWTYSPADSEMLAKFTAMPDSAKYPHAYRWYIHIAALQGIRGLSISPPVAAAAAAAPATKAAAAPAKAADDDDFDVFADDDEEDDEPKESRADMLARLKKEAEVRTAKKEANQRTLVALEIKPWDVEQDLNALFKKITETVNQEGLKWAVNCNLVDVAYGIQKIQTTFVMGATNSSDDVIEKILEMEDEVQSCEVISMNVL
jgi:elongation factor 1-beta